MNFIKENTNYLTANKNTLANLYYDSIEEKQAMIKLFELKKPNEQQLKDYIKIDNLIKAIARLILP